MGSEFVSSGVHEGCLVICVRFPHDLTVAEQEQAARELVACGEAGGGRPVIVDLSEADAAYSRFLGALLTVRQQQNQRGREVLLAAVRPLVKQALERCALDRVFETFPTADAAVKAALVKTRQAV
jgi:anti-anti-sigma factor